MTLFLVKGKTRNRRSIAHCFTIAKDTSPVRRQVSGLEWKRAMNRLPYFLNAPDECCENCHPSLVGGRGVYFIPYGTGLFETPRRKHHPFAACKSRLMSANTHARPVCRLDSIRPRVTIFMQGIQKFVDHVRM